MVRLEEVFGRKKDVGVVAGVSFLRINPLFLLKPMAVSSPLILEKVLSLFKEIRYFCRTYSTGYILYLSKDNPL
ncbi:MAG: hypothetical protein CSA04_02345 [Bacteroidetes bacterium]|nr:MAG: hypothetical protein CSA04_02345 [Bacteroidota bacterium]